MGYNHSRVKTRRRHEGRILPKLCLASVTGQRKELWEADYMEIFSPANWLNTYKTELAITWRKFQPGLSYPGWKFPCNRTKKFHPGLKRWLTHVTRCKLPKQQRLPTNSCLDSLPISVSARAEIFHVIGTFFNPVCRAEIFPCNQLLSQYCRGRIYLVNETWFANVRKTRKMK